MYVLKKFLRLCFVYIRGSCFGIESSIQDDSNLHRISIQPWSTVRTRRSPPGPRPLLSAETF